MHTETDHCLEQLHIAVQLLRDWADHCHGQAVVDDLTIEDVGDDEERDGAELVPVHPADRQAIYRYGYAIALEDAAAFLDDLLIDGFGPALTFRV